jgi:uncharacterized delta-60 repeat protein
MAVKRLVSLLGLAFLVLGPLGVSSASNLLLAGDLDPSFGSAGALTHSLGSGEDPSINGIAVQPDGKIVVAGGSVPGDHGLLIARYLPNGSPDQSFGDGGYVETQVGDWAFAEAVALESDGKLVVGGVSYQGDPSVLSEFTLARYNPDGSLDTSFGTEGITNTVIPEPSNPTPWWSGPDALAVLPGGKILAAGGSAWQNGSLHPPFVSLFALAQYTPAGSLDPTFGDGGIVQTEFGGAEGGRIGGIAVRPDRKIVVSDGFGFGMGLARYKPDGSLDHAFGVAGRSMIKHKPYGGGRLTLQHGKIVVAGYTRGSSTSNFVPVIARFTAGGHLDHTFGKRGFDKIPRLTGDDVVQGDPTDVVAQSDGKLLIAAADSVVRLRRNGGLDKSFGQGGIVSLAGGVATATLALQGGGKILVGGSTGNTLQTAGPWFLARLLGGNNCVVPSLSGKTVSKASVELKNSYCRRGRTVRRFSGQVIRGRVISTALRPGTRLRGGARVDLVVSRGKRPGVNRSSVER